MVISLDKGQKIDLTKGNPGLNKVVIGLGWDAKEKMGGHEYDLDASVFLLNKEGKMKDINDLIYYGNLEGRGVHHTGDNLTGDSQGDDEVINIDLSKIASDVDKIMFTANIYDAVSRKQNFGNISNAYIRVINPANNKELIRYNLGQNFSTETGLIVAEIYRENSEWKFNAIGESFEGGLRLLRKSLLSGSKNTTGNTEQPKKGFMSRLFGL